MDYAKDVRTMKLSKEGKIIEKFDSDNSSSSSASSKKPNAGTRNYALPIDQQIQLL
jgi:hypothetical protein